jgi:Protein of unknown function (DUF2812)
MFKIQKYDIYLQKDDFIQWIEELALQGLFIEDLYENSIFIKFRKDVPKRLKYELYFDGVMSVIEDFVDHAESLGWNLVGSENNKKSVFLFMTELENASPLEVDLEEAKQRLKYGLKKERFNLFLWLIVVLLLFRNIQHDINSMLIIQLSVYGFIFVTSIISFFRKNALLFETKKISRWVAIHAIKMYMVLWAFMSLVFGVVVYEYLNAKQIETGIHRDFVDSSYFGEMALSLERSTQSLWSFNPNATYLYQYQNEDEYTTMVYQTRQYHLIEPNQSFLQAYLYESHPAILTAFQLLDLVENSQNQLLYKNPYSETEFLSIKYFNQVIYTLHTINLSLEDHIMILNKMGDENVQ